MNDAKLSPNGQYLAAVGDHGYIWCAPILQPAHPDLESADRTKSHMDKNEEIDDDEDSEWEDEESDDDGVWIDEDGDTLNGAIAEGWEHGSIEHPLWQIGCLSRIEISKK